MTTNGTKPPVIKFKAYRYGHKLELIELSRKMEAGEATEEDDTKWISEMVIEWDFLDEDTGEPILVGDYKTLSIVQHAQLQEAWREYSADLWDEVVKKKRERNSSSS